MARNKVRSTLTFDEMAYNLLDRAGNASAYLSHLVQQRWREWTLARTLLHNAGWKDSDIMDAIETMDLTWETYDTQRCRGALDKHYEEPLQDPEVRALISLAAEYWAGNAELQGVLAPEA